MGRLNVIQALEALEQAKYTLTHAGHEKWKTLNQITRFFKHNKLDSTEDIVIIDRKEYRELLERDKWLSCLEGAGVDNWDGYDLAIEMREQAYGGR